tara:strand:+ start:2677 stop:4629 length:1953 start_codon:yes stop_codon:yes gene_type:complete
MAFFKAWPVWSERTGSSAITTSSVDPLDDAVRLCDYSPSEGDTSNVLNYPQSVGQGGKLFPVKENSKRTRALGQDFSCIGITPRVLNNRVNSTNDNLPVEDSHLAGDGTDLAAAAFADTPQDFNLYNCGQRQFTRIGANLVLTYFHFAATFNQQSKSDFLNGFLNNGSQIQPYFLCKDGVVRKYTLEWAVDEMDAAVAQLGSAQESWWNSGINDSIVSGDLLFLKFVGTPPSEDLVSIARPVRPHDMGDDVSDSRQHQGWSVDQMGRVAGTYTQDSGFVKSRSNNAYYWAEPCAVFSGDSGTPCIGMSGSIPILFGLLHSLNANKFNVIGRNTLDQFGIESISYAELDIPSVEGKRITGPIQIKRSSTASATPSSLLPGELAINDYDGKLFYRDHTGSVEELSSGGGGVSSLPNGVNTLDILQWNAATSTWSVSDISDAMQEQISLGDLTDVFTFGTPSDGSTLVYNAASQIFTPALLSVLPDGTADDQVLQWNSSSSEWQVVSPAAALDEKLSIEALSDVDFSSTPTNSQVLAYNASSGNWEAQNMPQALPEGTVANQLLQWNSSSSSWQLATPSSVVSGTVSVSSLSDTLIIGSPSSGQVLKYVSNIWTNSDPDVTSSDSSVNDIVTLTQSSYDALSSPDANTLYLIT